MAEEKKTFRVSAKKIFITWPQCNGLVKQDVIDKINEEAGTYSEFFLCEEKHEDGGKHFHAFLQYIGKKNIRNPRHFDVKGFHANFKACKKKQAAIQYLYKEDSGVYHEVKFCHAGVDGFLKHKQDYDAFTQYHLRLSLGPVRWPVQLPTGALLDKPPATLKKCNYWICGATDMNKTHWIERTFQYQRIYKRVGRDSYPYDHYDREEVIVYDDVYGIKLEEFIAVSNCYLTLTPVYGPTRYRRVFWPMGQRRIIFVLSNDEPCFQNMNAFRSRFNVIRMVSSGSFNVAA